MDVEISLRALIGWRGGGKRKEGGRGEQSGVGVVDSILMTGIVE